MDHERYRELLDLVALNQVGAAHFLGVDERTSRRWATGEKPVPVAAGYLLELMAWKRIAPSTVMERFGENNKDK